MHRTRLLCKAKTDKVQSSSTGYSLCLLCVRVGYNRLHTTGRSFSAGAEAVNSNHVKRHYILRYFVGT